jgi:hypothetical protein
VAEESIPDNLLTSPAVYAPRTLAGWSELQQAVNYTLPNLLTQAELRRQATMRLLARG